MKDEIKEILDSFKEILDNPTTTDECYDGRLIEIDRGYDLDLDEIKLLLDCITNLQEENKMYAQLKDEYEDIIEKAIEYVKENQYIKIHEEGFTHEGEEYYILPNSDIVLNILQGEDNENI